MIKVYIKKGANYSIGSPKIKESLKKIFTNHGIVSDSDVYVSFVGEKEMKDVARKYLKESNVIHNVLSFPEGEIRNKFIYPESDILHLGEIILCYPKLVEEAKNEGKLIDDKIIELVEHAALHLLGIHHE